MLVLNRKVLVLNKVWHAIGVITLKRAISLVYVPNNNVEPKARIIDPNEVCAYTWADWSKLRPEDGEACLKSAKDNFKIPEIILLSKYDKLPFHLGNFSRHTLFKRDGEKCQYCGKKPGTKLLTLEHVIPKSRGGKTNWDNVVVACVACNSKKANRTPEEAGMKLLRKPEKPKVNIFRSDICIDSWRTFVSECYWHIPLDQE